MTTRQRRLISSVGLGLIQFLFTLTTPLSPVEAKAGCSEENLRLENQSPPSLESREIRSVKHRFKFLMPANYRTAAVQDYIFIFSPQTYEYYQCQPLGNIWYYAAAIDIADTELPSGISLREAFKSQAIRSNIQSAIQGGIQDASIGGEPALRYHFESAENGLTRSYVLFSPQRTKLITISARVDSVNDPEPEMLARISNSFQLLFSVTETSPKIGIVPTLPICGLAV